MPAIKIASNNHSRLEFRAGRWALAFANATALVLRFSLSAAEMYSGLEAGFESGCGSSEAKGLELSGICGPPAQFSKRATMRVRSARASRARSLTQSPISRRVAA